MNTPSIIDTIADERDELRDENIRLKAHIKQLEDVLRRTHIKQLEDALRRIANTDYRGNRSTESQIAAEALESKR